MKYNVHVIPPIKKSKILCTYSNIKPVKPKENKNTRVFFKYKLDNTTYYLNLHIQTSWHKLNCRVNWSESILNKFKIWTTKNPIKYFRKFCWELKKRILELILTFPNSCLNVFIYVFISRQNYNQHNCRHKLRNLLGVDTTTFYLPIKERFRYSFTNSLSLKCISPLGIF